MLPTQSPDGRAHYKAGVIVPGCLRVTPSLVREEMATDHDRRSRNLIGADRSTSIDIAEWMRANPEALKQLSMQAGTDVLYKNVEPFGTGTRASGLDRLKQPQPLAQAKVGISIEHVFDDHQHQAGPAIQLILKATSMFHSSLL